MCQSIAQGGRRCATHHQATLAMKYLVRKYPQVRYPLNIGQTDFIFKSLRREGHNHPAPSAEEYREYLNETKEMIQSQEPPLENANSIIAKLDRAIETDQIPDGSSFYALKHMVSRASATRRAMLTEVRNQAELTGESQSRIRRKFSRMYGNLVTRRGEPDFRSVLDPKTREVFDHLRRNVELRFEEDRRITMEPTGNALVVMSGYDPEDGRLEVDMAYGDRYAYHSVSEEDYARFRENPVDVLNEIRISHEHDYTTNREAEKDAYRLWCEACQAFRVASGHVCQRQEGRVSGRLVRHDVDEIYGRVVSSLAPIERGTIPTEPAWRRAAEDRTQTHLDDDGYTYPLGSQGRNPSHAQRIMPDVSKIVAGAKEGDIVHFKMGRRIFVQGTDQREHNDVTVDATAQVVRGNRQIEISYDASNPKCTCEVYQNNGRCTHTHPSDGNRINRFVETDIMQAMADISGEHDGYRVASPYYGMSRNVVSIAPEGEEVAGGFRALSDEQVNGILYEMSLDPHAEVSVQLLDEDNQSVGYVTATAASRVQINDANRSMDRETYRLVRDRITDQLREGINGTDFMRDRLRNQAERSVSNGWETNAQSRDAYLARFSSHASEGYLRNPDQFLEDYHEAVFMNESRQSTFIEGSVTGGNLSNVQGQGRGFGIEIEVSGDYDDIDYLISRLNEAGLSDTDYLADYHEDNDFTSWRVEEDGSVTGEIVSPILYDTPESWAQVRRVCEIVREVGLGTDESTGNHVHIGAAGISNEQRRGIFAAVVANQDVIRRVATDPGRGHHRSASGGNYYTSPFSDSDVQSVYSSRGSHYNLTLGHSRSRMANFTNENTIEFRDPDGSLDPAHIQANVMMAAALTSAGEHGNWSDLDHARVHSQRVGVNAMRQTYINNVIEDDDERVLAGNISLMTTLDALFPERDQRQRILGVAVRNQWQGEPREDRW